MTIDQGKIDEFVSNIAMEFMRGTLILLLLLVIDKKGATHGYEIIQEIFTESKDLEGHTSVELSSGIKLKEGTIYPHLNKLNALGFLESWWDRNRRMYKLTPAGIELLARIKNTYQYFGTVMKKFL
nr:PadR family transcriptional regulator [Candidatus Sigynarchaeota archaeon]